MATLMNLLGFGHLDSFFEGLRALELSSAVADDGGICGGHN